MAKTVMIVDDERDIRDLVKIVLEKNKYAVITATDGDDCLGKLKTAKPNLILMDMRMPGTPVKEVTRRIKGTKIVYLSGMSSTDSDTKRLINPSHPSNFLQKPFGIDELLKMVKSKIG